MNEWMDDSHLPCSRFDIKESRPVTTVPAEHQLSVTSHIHVISLQWRHSRVGRKRVRHSDGVVDVIGEEEDGAVVVLVHDSHGDGDSGGELGFAQVVGKHCELVPVKDVHGARSES